jgi:hypothetical protein
MNATKGPVMKLKTYLVLAAVIALPLATLFAQSSTESQPRTPALSPGGAEVVQLAQSGVGDDVILGFISHSQVYYNLTAADIVALKNSGVSPKAVTAMLNHDVTLHNQQLASNARPVTTTESTDSATPPTASSPAAATTVVVTPPPMPAPQIEVIPVCPGPDYEWTPGWWSWNGGAWIWFRGYWGYPVRPGHIWHDGRFYHGHGVEVIRGHRR